MSRCRAILIHLLDALALLSVACASALKEPPPIADLAGTPPPVEAGEVPALLSRAEALLAERDLDKARTAAQVFLRAATAETAPIEALVGAVRARVWLTDHDPDARAREQAATSAVDAAQWCRRKAPLDPACDYWLGVALGVQARERPSTGLSALPEIEREFQRAAQARPELDDAGPDRALALLYLRAPRWPAGPGDPELGLKHARAAVALRPDYPPNRLALAEALAATGDRDGSLEARRRALDLARAMAEKGDRDAPEWVAEAAKESGGR
jgi:tetratricopeptide (TPR) repeat protein